jgi:exodeoxyribonuclease V alpha subunit
MPQRHSKTVDSDFYLIERSEPERIRDLVIELVLQRIPGKVAVDPICDIQVLCPMNRGAIGAKRAQ